MRKLTTNPKDLLVIKELEKMAMEENWVFAYDHEIVRKKTENSIRFESYQKGLEAGKEEGIKENQIEIAKNLLKLKTISIEDISKSNGLTIEEINKL